MAPKGSMTYAFTHMGNFLLLLLLLLLGSGLLAGIWTSRLRFGPQGWDLGLQARILAFRLGFGPRGWDLGLKTGIWASRLEFGPRDWDLRGGGMEEGEKEKEKIPHMCESIGHRPFQSRCPAPPLTSSITQ